jgi:hypothetical protein
VMITPKTTKPQGGHPGALNSSCGSVIEVWSKYEHTAGPDL